ncbi:MAG: response regulator [Treponemataceae bacterium]|nr:response regulator [Treponemataceae bacterium]
MKTLARKIALRFFFVIALMVLCLSLTLLALINWSSRQSKNKEITNALGVITSAVKNGESLYVAEGELPYYITYTVYEESTKEIYATNDHFIPILPLENGTPVEYVEKDYYTDGDLRLLYATSEVDTENTTYIVQISMAIDKDEEQNSFYYYARLILLTFIPLLLISYLASFFIAKRTLHPIVEMTKTAEKITTSELDTMLDVSDEHNELDALAVTFNTLFANLNRDIHAINAANEAKSAFLSNMSHEIRTPINAVLGLDEMIMRDTHEPEIKNYALEIQSSGKSLLSIVNDILDFSKIEAGKMEILPFEYDLSSTVNDLVNMVASRAEKKGLELKMNVDPNVPHCLFGDETRIKQCILNILTNAVKYTNKGSVTMNISFEKIDDSRINLKAQVIDTGIGIKEEDLKKLFSPFERIEENRNRTIEGTGLGMSIVKSLLAAMETKLDVKSVYGEGSDFSFVVEQKVVDWEPMGDYDVMKLRALEQAGGEYHESFQAPDAQILVIDDTPMNLTVFCGLLRSTRIQIDKAESGIQALNMAHDKKYDMLFVDHRMPKMDGIEMLKILRDDETSVNQHSICIALTANAISGAKEMYLASGFEGYLSKPVDGAKLESVLAQMLPPEKVLKEGDEGFIKHDSSQAKSGGGTATDSAGGAKTGNAVLSADDAVAISEIFAKKFGVNIADGLRNCSGADIYMDAARNFYDAIEEKSAEIEQFGIDEDWTNYTVLVHALKSSARLIGAGDLSALAASLEAAGDKAKSGDAAGKTEIEEKTPLLLEQYRSYKPKLAPLFEEFSGSSVAGNSQNQENKSQLPEISVEEFKEAMSALKEVVSAYDFGSADMILEELSGYSVPDDFADKFTEIKKAVKIVDQQTAMKFLEEI